MDTNNKEIKDIYLAGGCFWGTEHYFKQIEGVVATEVGFANGLTKDPTYEEVYTDTTGFAETVHVKYNPDVVSLGFLLQMFFKAIDPTSLNKQGHDEGTRYRTGVYYTNPEDLPIIEKAFQEEQERYQQPLAVEKLPLENFYTAEEYHQDYLDKNPTGYCHLPKSLFDFAKTAKDIMKNAFTIRPAKPKEAGLVLEFIKKLAVYEKCADEVVADEATVYHSLFVERSAEVVFAEENGMVIGFALFFHNFSTFVGRKGLYLEDLFILPEKRGRGYGKALLKHLAKIAVERNCGRMEWICLDWNEPALKVYRSIGAVPMDEWTVQRLDEDALREFSKS